MHLVNDVLHLILQFLDPISLHKCLKVSTQFFQVIDNHVFWHAYYNHFFHVPMPLNIQEQINFKQLFMERYQLYHSLYMVPFLQKFDSITSGQGSILDMPDLQNTWSRTMHKMELVQYQLEFLKIAKQAQTMAWQQFVAQPYNCLVKEVKKKSNHKAFEMLVYGVDGLCHTLKVGFKIEYASPPAARFDSKILFVNSSESLAPLQSLAAAWNVTHDCTVSQFSTYLDNLFAFCGNKYKILTSSFPNLEMDSLGIYDAITFYMKEHIEKSNNIFMQMENAKHLKMQWQNMNTTEKQKYIEMEQDAATNYRYDFLQKRLKHK